MAVAASRPPRRVSVGHVALMLPLVAAVIASRLPVRDNSYLWHVRAGTLQMDLGRVLTADPFSFTAQGRHWRTQSWLVDLLYGWGDLRWGLSAVTPLVLVGSILLVLSIGLRVYRTVPFPIPAAVGTVWVMWLTIGYFTPRPVLFSLALLGLFLVVADDRRLRWAIPLLMWVWASVHGGFIVGLGYLVLDGLRVRDKHRVGDLVAATAVTAFSAHGWGTWEVVLKFLGSGQALDLITEWLTPDLISIEHFPFTLALVALLWGSTYGHIRRSDLWVVIPFVLFAFTANRSVPISGLVLAPWFIRSLPMAGRLPAVTTRGQGLVNSGLVVAVALIPWLIPLSDGISDEMFAVEAVRHLGPEATFHDDAVGGYLIYTQWPQRLVYIDDRAELYEEDFIDFVRARAGLPGWDEVFERHDLQQALVKVSDPIGEILVAEGWIEQYRDDRFLVLRAPDI